MPHRASRRSLSIATSDSASRWRTAWNPAIGWPNWIRSRACTRASSSIVRDGADEFVGDRQAGDFDRCGPVDRCRFGPRLELTGLIPTSPSRGSRPCDRTQAQRGDLDGLSRPSGRRRSPRREPRPPRPAQASRCRRRRFDRALLEPVGAVTSERRENDRDRLVDAERGGEQMCRARTRPPGPALEFEVDRDRCAAGHRPDASCQPSSASAASSAAPLCGLVGVAQRSFEQLEVVAVDHRSFPRSSSRRAMMLRWISALPP